MLKRASFLLRSCLFIQRRCVLNNGCVEYDAEVTGTLNKLVGFCSGAGEGSGSSEFPGMFAKQSGAIIPAFT